MQSLEKNIVCSPSYSVLSISFVALISLQELVRLPLRKSVQFIYRKSSREYFRETLKDIKNRNIYSIIVDTKPESLPLLLTAVSFTSITFILFCTRHAHDIYEFVGHPCASCVF